MPTIPKETVTVSALQDKAPQIINNLMKETGLEYTPINPMAQSPQQTAALQAIGDVVMSFAANQNMFLNTLVNRIALTMITSKLYRNPWSLYKRGLLNFGETVQEVFVRLVDAIDFDPVDAQDTVFKITKPQAPTAYHTLNYQKLYPITTSRDQLRQAFLSMGGVTDLIAGIIQQVYTSANYDEFVMMKYMIAQGILKGNITVQTVNFTVDPNNVVNLADARLATTALVNKARAFTYMDDRWNYAHVVTATDPRDLSIIVSSDLESILDVNLLAVAFNMNKAELMGRRVPFDSFFLKQNDITRLQMLLGDAYVPFTANQTALLTSIHAVLLDEKFFMIFDNLIEMTDIQNPKGLYWNYFYHTWKTFSYSPFCNVIAFSFSPTVLPLGITVLDAEINCVTDVSTCTCSDPSTESCSAVETLADVNLNEEE